MSERAGIYLRVSTREQEQGWSLAGQERKCREYTTRQGYDLVHVYSDVASGSSPQRDGFQALLTDAHTQAFTVVVVWRRDRWGRDTAYNQLFERALHEAGARLESTITGPVDPSPETRLYATVQDAIDTYEVEKTTERLQLGREQAALEGRWPGGSPPHGYQLEDHHLVPDPTSAHEVRWAYRQIAEGRSSRTVAKRLNWHHTTLLNRIGNLAYLGTIDYAGHRTPNAHTPLVDPETWLAANRALDARARYYDRTPSTNRANPAET